MDSIRNIIIDTIQNLNPGSTVDVNAPFGKLLEQLRMDILNIKTLSFEVVQEKPTTNIKTNVIYLIPKTTAETNNVYEEWIYSNNSWELIGSTTIDITGKMDIPSTALSSDDTSGVAMGQIFKYNDEFYIKTSSAMPVGAQFKIENAKNKVTSLSSSSTDDEYVSAKCVYDMIGDVESLLAAI